MTDTPEPTPVAEKPAVSGGHRDSETEWHRPLNFTHWMPLPPPPASESE